MLTEEFGIGVHYISRESWESTQKVETIGGVNY